jgi:LacI family transcriptional regulator
MTTIRDVAAACGVSPMTVSLVLNNRGRVSAETRERVLQAVRDLDYRPGVSESSSRRKPMNVLGVMADAENASLTRPGYFNSVLNGLLAATDHFEQHVLLFTRTRQILDPYVNIRQFCDGRCDGLVVLGAQDGSELVEAIHLRGFPMVMIGASAREAIPNVDLDNLAAGARMTRTLLDLGHRRIAFVGGPDFVKSARLRHEGYRQALKDWGIECEPALEVLNIIWPHEGALQIHSMLELPAGRRPTAVFGWNDGAAIGVIHVAQSLGLRVPADLSVLGIDNDPQGAECHPALTTLRQPYGKIGQAAVELLLAQVRDSSTQIHHLTFPGDLIVRKSTAPPPTTE